VVRARRAPWLSQQWWKGYYSSQGLVGLLCA
jgi:hypothetical protein